ncbi:MAG: hypothetical protein Q4E02_00215 [Lagierella massiliensis]|nr:hypothetical protein [Lagierella massiliensis]
MKQLSVNILKNKWKQFLPLFFLALITVIKLSSISGGNLKDYFFYFYEGMDMFEPGGSQVFELPYLWFLLHSYILFLVGRDLGDELDILETKLLFEKGRVKFRFIKFFTILFKAILSIVIFLLSIVLFKETVGRFVPAFEGVEYFNQGNFPMELYNDEVLYETMVKSVLGILIFSVILQLISYFIDERISFIMVNLIMISGLFLGKSTLLINGMMIRRYSYSANILYYIVVLSILIVTTIMLFKAKEKNKDYLGVFR